MSGLVRDKYKRYLINRDFELAKVLQPAQLDALRSDIRINPRVFGDFKPEKVLKGIRSRS